VNVGKVQAGDRTLILIDANMGVYMVAEGKRYLDNQPSYSLQIVGGKRMGL
jgi:hypothetical protein